MKRVSEYNRKYIYILIILTFALLDNLSRHSIIIIIGNKQIEERKTTMMSFKQQIS